MKFFLSLISPLVLAGLVLVVLDARAQDAPAAVVTGTCKDPDFDRRTISSPVQFDLLIRVDDVGEVVSVHALNDVGNSSLLSAVVTAAKSCKYFPAISNGKPTSGNIRLLFPVLPPPQVPRADSLTVESLHACAPTGRDYPSESRRNREEGTTSVTFTVDKTGKVTAFGVTKSSGFLRLDFVTLAKLALCKFKPGTAADGTPVGGSFTVDYNWKLE